MRKIDASKEYFPEVEEFIAKNFPEDKYRCTIAEYGCGDIQIVFVYNLDNPRENYVIDYNSWYTEVILYKLEKKQ